MNCLTCRHNTYKDIKDCDFFDCVHPDLPMPVWSEGMPSMAAYRTGDVHKSLISEFDNCPTYEASKGTT